MPGGPASIALKTGAPLLPCSVYHDRRPGHWRAVVHPPLHPRAVGRQPQGHPGPDPAAGRRVRGPDRRRPHPVARAQPLLPPGAPPGMNIGLVCPYEWTVPGGVGNHVRALAAELRRAGHRVDVLAPAERPVTEPGFVGLGGSLAVPYNGSVARIAFGPRTLARVRRAVHRGGYDLLHVHEPLSPSVGLLAVTQSGRALGAGGRDLPRQPRPLPGPGGGQPAAAPGLPPAGRPDRGQRLGPRHLAGPVRRGHGGRPQRGRARVLRQPRAAGELEARRPDAAVRRPARAPQGPDLPGAGVPAAQAGLPAAAAAGGRARRQAPAGQGDGPGPAPAPDRPGLRRLRAPGRPALLLRLGRRVLRPEPRRGVVRDRPGRGHGRRPAGGLLRHRRLPRRGPRRQPTGCWSRPATPRPWPRPWPACSTTRPAWPPWARRRPRPPAATPGRWWPPRSRRSTGPRWARGRPH